MSDTTPKPHPPKKGFEKLGTAATEAGTALKKLSDTMEQAPKRPPFVRKEHLTQRPFINPALVSLRDGMQRSVRIKKK